MPCGCKHKKRGVKRKRKSAYKKGSGGSTGLTAISGQPAWYRVRGSGLALTGSGMGLTGSGMHSRGAGMRMPRYSGTPSFVRRVKPKHKGKRMI